MADEVQLAPLLERRIVDFSERPICQACRSPMIICSHSMPSRVIGFDGPYYTLYIEYTCGNSDCSQHRKGKLRAPNPWRIDRHKYDCEVEAEVAHQRFKGNKTYREIMDTMELRYSLEISEKTIGNIIKRYEVVSKLEQDENFFVKSQEHDGIFIGIDTMAPLKGEEKHIVAMDHFTQQTLLVERVRSENTEAHITFQRNLKKLAKQHKVKVLGFMSDDHVAQRKAIREVWGSQMKHCRCLFHFQKRIMLEAFKLNSKLKTKARARIRQIYYVKLFREEKLDPIENATVWQFLLEIIKDLAALQQWKNKRNDTDLESIAFYQRLTDIYHLLATLQSRITSITESAQDRAGARLKLLMKEVKAILDDLQHDYNDLVRIKSYQEALRRIFEAHEDSSQLGLEKLVSFTEELETRLKAGAITCEAAKFFIEQLCSFVYERGESLFQYRDIKNANNTNNTQEAKFKAVKHAVRRTQGIATGARYFQQHAKYMLYVNPDLSREEIRQFLLRADYKKVAQILKEEQALRKRPLARIKSEDKWKSRKRQLKEKLQEI